VVPGQVMSAQLMTDRLANSYLGFDGPGAYRNKAAQSEQDEMVRNKMRAEHAEAVKKFREHDALCKVQEKALMEERRVRPSNR
jgi:hypothetical protein